MKEISKNKKIIYGVIVVIVLIGIVMTATLKLNFSLMYSDNTRVKVYLEKEYNIEDINDIAKEVFGTKKIVYQEVEFFKEAISITVQDATDEQIENFKNKLQEKYEIESLDGLVQTNQVAHLRLSDIVKPYILPLVIVTMIVLVYVGIRYAKLGILNVIITLSLRIIAAEALFFSLIAITRIPVSVYLMPVTLGIYILVTTFTLVIYQNQIEKLKVEENKK